MAVSKARRYSSYTEMLGKEQLDCVGICNNTRARAAAIIACAESKLNVIADSACRWSRRTCTEHG